MNLPDASDRRPRAFTLDLDDTLWPILPTLRQAERVLRDWLARHAPATLAWDGGQRMAALRQEVGRAHPELAHDLTELRLITLRRALAAAGDDPALADPAFDAFMAVRQQVRWFDDVRPALQRLAAHGPLLSLSNGNADLQATGLAPWFVGAVSARVVGVAKPDARIFGVACERLGLAPQEVMHIGDDWQADIVGARRAGLHSAWVRRSHPELAPHTSRPGALPPSTDGLPEVDGHHVEVEDLLQLVDWLDGLPPVDPDTDRG